MTEGAARFAGLAAALSAAHGLPPPEPAADGSVDFVVDGGLVVSLRSQDNATVLTMTAGLGPVLAAAEAAWHAALLDAGLFGAGSGGGRFGIDSDGAIVLRRCVPLDDGLDAARLEERFRRFAQAAVAWRERLREQAGEGG
ncbi:MAG TPA: type III secretion system chaperone [Geminicoccaceae bacterium]|nr:type III secretion system chaperone [Geminicoccus sp.]HMU52810.1 type III secretion system chaperone [Geminicoccaceae bacterium]